MKPDFEKGDGLLTTVVTDADTKDVLMVAWMNAESYQRTLASGQTWFGHGLGKNFGTKALRAAIYKMSLV